MRYYNYSKITKKKSTLAKYKIFGRVSEAERLRIALTEGVARYIVSLSWFVTISYLPVMTHRYQTTSMGNLADISEPQDRPNEQKDR